MLTSPTHTQHKLCVLFFALFLGWSLGSSQGCTSPQPTQEKPREHNSESSPPDAGTPDFNHCKPTPQDGPRCPAVSLLDIHKWQPVTAKEDPFLAFKKPGNTCSSEGTRVEDGVFEIDTGLCNYLTVQQPLQEEIRAGEVVQFTFLHSELKAESKAEALVALSIGGELVWQKTIPIPSDPDYYQPTWTAKKHIPKGTQAIFHLHNHGSNNWRIHSLTTGAPE